MEKWDDSEEPWISNPADHIWVASIHIDGWGQKIACYGKSKEESTDLRQQVMAADPARK